MRQAHKHPWRFFPAATNPYAAFSSKVGFLLALAYTGLYAFAFSLSLVRIGQASLARMLLGLLVLLILPLTIGFVVGVLGGCVIGGLTGTLIGWIFSHFHGRLSPPPAGLIGFEVCLTLILVVHSIIFGLYAPDLTNTDRQRVYLLYVGLPSCLYLTAGGIGSSVMYRRQTRASDEATD